MTYTSTIQNMPSRGSNHVNLPDSYLPGRRMSFRPLSSLYSRDCPISILKEISIIIETTLRTITTVRNRNKKIYFKTKTDSLKENVDSFSFSWNPLKISRKAHKANYKEKRKD